MTTRTYEPMRGFPQSIGTTNGATVLRNLGFIYDERGLMKTRTNYVGGDSETFTHDELDRLVHWGGGAGWSVDYGYDDIGNMTTRTSAQPGQSEMKIFTTGGPRPHALTSVANDTYGYDGAGRQTTGPNRIVTYTDFDLPRTIKKDGVNWSFQYDANHSRAVKQKESGDTTFYFGGFYEVRRSPGTPDTHVMYIPGPGSIIAQAVTQTEGTDAVVEYLHSDHLGSVTTVAGAGGTGTPAAQVRFDPFGARIGASSPPMSLLRLDVTGQRCDEGLHGTGRG